MIKTTDYLDQLKKDKQTLVDNLVAKGITATNDETFTSLVPKINDIETGGGDEELLNSYLSLVDDTLGANVTKLPNGLSKIGNFAFYNCTNLALTSLPDSLVSIGDNAFGYCTNLSLVSLPNSLVSIGDGAFGYCTNLALTSLPDSIVTIGTNAFERTKLSITKLPSNLNKIGNYAFSFCNNLTSLDVVSQLLTSIGGSAFRNNSNLKQIIFRATTPPTLGSNAFGSTPIASGNGYIYVPDEFVDAYKTASGWSAYAAQIKGISELEG